MYVAHSGKGSVRIIGGSWRGRKLSVADAPGLRPTADRVRETLFNWLAPDTPNARCLDLFAGTGALGLEALSRGASYCCFVEQNREVAETLRGNLHTLDSSDRSDVYQRDALAYLADLSSKETVTPPFDLVFLDPPFAAELLSPVLAELANSTQLSASAQIYIEHPSNDPSSTPPGWRLRRSKQSGDVSYGLLERD